MLDEQGEPILDGVVPPHEGRFLRGEDGMPLYGTMTSPYGTDTYLLVGPPELKAPDINNERARFYFTERGWKLIGRHLAAMAVRHGHVVKIIRRKNPDRSQIVYEDELQVAILPMKRRRGDRA